jgi:hypothetical protein
MDREVLLERIRAISRPSKSARLAKELAEFSETGRINVRLDTPKGARRETFDLNDRKGKGKELQRAQTSQEVAPPPPAPAASSKEEQFEPASFMGGLKPTGKLEVDWDTGRVYAPDEMTDDDYALWQATIIYSDLYRDEWIE